MAAIELTQSEADDLLGMHKVRVDDIVRPFPSVGESASYSLKSPDGREEFLLDVSRARIKVAKCTLQHRARSVVVLARLDLDGPAHRNPDGTVVPCLHIHLYREGFADKWASDVSGILNVFPADLRKTYDSFCDFCSIIEPPLLQPELF